LIRQDQISATTPTVSFKYDYDKVGNLTQTEELIAGSTTATTTYAYDPRNLNTELTQTGVGLTAKRVKFTYDPQGQTTQIERYLGATTTPVLTTTNAYDAYGRLFEIEQTDSSGVVIAHSLYGFDNLSRLISETKDGVNRLVDYDKIDQVTAVTGSNTEAYSYDPNGNRTNPGYDTGVNNQLNSDGTYNYQYDGEGNRTNRTKITTGEVDNYTWDYRNRLTTVESKNAAGVVTQTVGYEYDVDDQRVSKTVNGVVENYYLDGSQIAFVTDEVGNQLFHYLYGLNVDQVLAQDSPTGMVWSLADRLGTVDTLADAGGTVVDKRTFDSFGRLLSQTNPSLNFRYGYTGRELDLESGLAYYRARYYDPQVGRFISVDPAGFGAGDTNLYRYVGNNSMMYTDPTGMWSLPSWNDLQQGWNNFTQSAQKIGNFYTGVAADAGTSISQGVSQLRLPSLNEIGQGFNDFGNSWQTATNYWGGLLDEAGTNIGNAIHNSTLYQGITSTAQQSMEYYVNLGIEGQREGGVVGLLKQGWGWQGGLFSSLATKGNLDKTGEVLAFLLGGEVVSGLKWAKTLAANPFVKSGLALAGGYQGGGQLRQAWTGEGENGRQLSVVERVTVGVTGLATIGTSLLSLRNPAPKTECFVAGTEIQTINGTKNIEDIQVGDWVLSDDPNTVGEIEYKQVLNTFVKETSNLVDIYIDGEMITTTEEHPFWVPDLGWVAAKDLAVGSLLQTKYESWLDVDKVELHGGLATVYNFEVQGFHTYFVSDLGLLVHNVCDPNDLPTLNTKQAGKALESPLANVNVKLNTREEADQLLKKFIVGKGYRNSTGYTGNQVRQNKDLFPNAKDGTYHWDYADTQHGGVPHVQIHDFNGKIHHIFFEKGGGLPITGGDLRQLGDQMNRLSGL
jgi:RHS repeat-associated protein